MFYIVLNVVKSSLLMTWTSTLFEAHSLMFFLCRFAFVFVIMAATDSVQTSKTISLQVVS